MKTITKEFIPVYFDLSAKNLFGTNRNVRFTEDLLEKYYKLKTGTLRGCNIKNNVVLTSEVINGKNMEMDIKVELPNKSIVNLEFYSIYVEGSETKSFMYASKIISNELVMGEDYDSVKRVHQINFIHDDHVRRDKNAIKRYLVMNIENPNDFILRNLFEIDIINVDIKDKRSYNEDNKDFDKWRRFIGASSYKEMEEIAKGDAILEDAMEEVKRFNNSEEVLDYYKINEKLRRSECNALRKEGLEEGKEEGRKLGIKEGMKEGIEQGLKDGFKEGIKEGNALKEIEIVKNMLKNNLSIQDISKYTGLSIKRIEELKDN